MTNLFDRAVGKTRDFTIAAATLVAKERNVSDQSSIVRITGVKKSDRPTKENPIRLEQFSSDD